MGHLPATWDMGKDSLPQLIYIEIKVLISLMKMFVFKSYFAFLFYT